MSQPKSTPETHDGFEIIVRLAREPLPPAKRTATLWEAEVRETLAPHLHGGSTAVRREARLIERAYELAGEVVRKIRGETA